MQYSLRRSERAKHTRIVVKPDKVEVVAPHKMSERQIKAFVDSQRDWILKAMERIASKQQAIPSLAPMEYADGATIPYLGHQIPIQLKASNAKTIRIQLQAEQIFFIYLPVTITSEQKSALIRLAVIRWMKNQARLQAGKIIEKHALRLALFPRSLRIKTQKSRWGSCGPQNDINLNWLLMLAPAAALEYVVVHELCHIKHKNHSPAFWQLVAEHLPDYQQQRSWLKLHGVSLMRGL